MVLTLKGIPQILNSKVVDEFWPPCPDPNTWTLLQNKAYVCSKMVIWLTPFNCPRGLYIAPKLSQ